MRFAGQTQNDSRRGASWLVPLSMLVLITGVGSAAAWYGLRYQQESKRLPPLPTCEVTRGTFRYTVTGSGEVAGASSLDVRCEVQSRNTGGTAILEIVPEGTHVRKGERICRLDSSALSSELNQQRITAASSEAAVVKAASLLDTAKIAREEYLNGTFKQAEQTAQSEIAKAEEDYRAAEEFARNSAILAQKGFVTPLQLKADEFAAENARMNLEAARTKLTVLRDFTKAKMLTQLDADIAAAEASLRSQQNIHQVDLERIAHLEKQIALCDVLAPGDGQVVYANQVDRGATEIIIAPGVMVREKQMIARLPDPRRIQVRMKVDEAFVDRVHRGQTATVRLDAFPAQPLIGTVDQIDSFPLAANFRSVGPKQYGVTIQVTDPPADRMRPGMTAQVSIDSVVLDDVLMVPVQAIAEREGQRYCLAMTPGGFVRKNIEIGDSTDRLVVVKSGLTETDRLVLEPRRYLDKASGTVESP